MSVAYEYDAAEVDAALARLSDPDMGALLDALGAEMVSQTLERLGQTKVSPQGRPWRPWSPAYARTRHGGHSLLESEGFLRDSITHEVSGLGVVVGSNLPYARAHQEGRPEINLAARPFLGLSPEDAEDLEDLARSFLGGLL